MERDFLGISAPGKQEFIRGTPNDSGSGANFPQQKPIYQPKMSNLQQFMSYKASQEERLGPINIFDQFSSPGLNHHLPSSIQPSVHLSQKIMGAIGIGGQKTHHPQHHPYTHHQIYPYYPSTNSFGSNLNTRMIPMNQTGTFFKAHGNSTVKSQVAPPVAPRNSATAQLTIFYGGSVHVYDEIPVEKAEQIIDIANRCSKVGENVIIKDETPLLPSVEVEDSNKTVLEINVNSTQSTTGSTSADDINGQKTGTTFAAAAADDINGPETSRTISPAAPIHPPHNSSVPMSRAVPMARKASLARFLEKRKERVITNATPYSNEKPGGSSSSGKPTANELGGGGPSFEMSLLGSREHTWCVDKWKNDTTNGGTGMAVPNTKLEI